MRLSYTFTSIRMTAAMPRSIDITDHLRAVGVF